MTLFEMQEKRATLEAELANVKALITEKAADVTYPVEELKAQQDRAEQVKARLDIINASTGINEVNGQWSSANGQSPIYNLSGRKLNGKPTQKGIYIHQGRKIQMK